MELQLSSTKIFVSNNPVDFRKGIDGLSEYVTTVYASSPLDGLYVFYNKGKDKLKILFWHNNGFVLIQKRLEKNRFIINPSENIVEIDNKQLSWLLAGLDWSTMSDWKELSYNDYY